MSEFDLTTIDESVIVARGQYATVRSAREDALKLLSRMCTDLQSIPSMVLRSVQDGQEVGALLKAIDDLSVRLKEQTQTVLDLHNQKEALKPEAWGRSTTTMKE